LGEDISDLPMVGMAPEWFSQKALSIGTYFVASGAYVLFGVSSPVSASGVVTDLISSGWEKDVGGKLEFEPDFSKIVSKSMDHILAKRRALKIDQARERKLFDMADRRALETV
ncbi:MAG: carbon monoxide dehydrogenase, partial [Planctomycetota bacterium]